MTITGKDQAPTNTGTVLATLFAMLAFASNSVLCRMALGTSRADPSSFTAIRLLSAALTLSILLRLRKSAATTPWRDSWTSPFMLFAYASAFSFAYVSLSTGTGALILFGSVQATMILVALASGERPHPLQWAGLTVALAGLVYLVLPGLSAPAPLGAALMVVAGISWGVYSLRGRATSDPLASTTVNFLRSIPFVAVLVLATLGSLHTAGSGALLAVGSGSLASGLGYVVWYTALRGLTTTRAATVQLTVPVLAAAGGVFFLNEPITLRLGLATLLILGGVGLAVCGRQRASHAASSSPLGP